MTSDQVLTLAAGVSSDPGMALILFTTGALALGVVLGAVIVWVFERRRADSASREADRLLGQAKAEAESVRKQGEVAAKEEGIRRREQIEQELSGQRKELRELERRLSKREDNLERKVDLLNKKERYIENLEQSLAVKRTDLADQQAELERLLEEEKSTLHKISGLSRQDAEGMLMQRLERELEGECAKMVANRVRQAKETSEQQARKILGVAIQRYAADHTTETVVSAVDLPNEDMKGRIIGREGRNIRAFEKATGMDVIVDDTPGVIVVSGFDGVRREIARRSMEKLVQDGRIHPARIEEVVSQTQAEMEQHIMEAGREAAFDCGIHNLPDKEVELLGRLKYRTSYGQNQLAHALEVAHLAGTMAGELGLDVQLARRCGLLHDIGKAVDHEVEGGHPEIGAEVAKKCGECPEVVDAIRSHHEDAEAGSIYTVLVGAADAISAARPGARRETLEKYIKRLERLEEIAGAFPGVQQAYAIQAGREVRVIVEADKVADDMAQKMCRDIARQVEQEMTYPGEIRVTVIRESRFIEVAH